jgi:uncharacterized membrane protein (UPF0127 family)
MQNKETKKTELAHKKNNYLPYAFVAVLLAFLLIIGGVLLYKQVNTKQYIQAKIGKDIYTLEVAETDADRIQGLSERNGLAKKTGMLFDFKQNGDWQMIMRQMRFPIDIAWLDETKKIIHIKHNATPAEYPEVYKADGLSRYVIEVPSGTFISLDVQEGDSISF